jgi:DNA (cytosine-5)-methyltransferase 1
MSRPRILDLFCCAGGAAMGYHQAGFDVVGVDINPQPRYPFEFIRNDVFEWGPDALRDFDAIHASPPCQGYSEMRHAPGAKGAPRLIAATRALLRAQTEYAWSYTKPIPYVIENVVGARSAMINPTLLCGTMFGLGTQGHDLQRHRLFETSFPMSAPQCRHGESPVVGVYGGHARRRSAKHGGRGTRDVWEGGHKAAASEAMGIDWMTLGELSEAIPPAYTRFIGEQLMRHLGHLSPSALEAA